MTLGLAGLSLCASNEGRGEAGDESSAGLGTGEPARHAVRNVGLQALVS